MEHFKKCRPTIDDACASLFDAQTKLKRNVTLLRQVRSLKRQNLSLRRENRALRLQVSLDKESMDKLNDPILCCQLDSHMQPQHEDLCVKSLRRFRSQHLRSRKQNLLRKGDSVV
jgi:hypothetical protein